MSIQKDLAAIREADLLALIEQSVFEDKSTEYKETLNLQGDEAKKKFLAGIASFANASGGDLIYGMKADDGRPVALQALIGFNPDQTLLTLRDLLLAHIDPKIYDIGFQPVDLADGGHALVIRVPKTWAGAHMLTYNKVNRFYTRDMNGRRLMDVPEIRSAFSLAEATAERIRRFRMERLGAIVADETPVKLSGTARVILHLCPLASFEPGYRCNVKAVRSSRLILKPMRVSGWDHSYNFDGDYAFTPTPDRTKSLGYSLLFHNGCMEIADATILEPVKTNGGKIVKVISGGDFEEHIVEGVAAALSVLKVAAAEPPLLLMLTLVGARGYMMHVSGFHSNWNAHAIDRDVLAVPEQFMDSFNLDKPAVAVLMRPLFDSVWNACGWEGSANYGADGVWSTAG